MINELFLYIYLLMNIMHACCPFLRQISAQIYNEISDYEALATALKEILEKKEDIIRAL